MGFTPTRKVYVLDFPEHPGLEIKVREGTIGQVLALQHLSGKADDSPEDMGRFFTALAKLIKSWNVDLLDEDGEPILDEAGQPLPAPVTAETLTSLPTGLAADIARVLGQTLGGVPGPLPETSADGSPSAVASLPTVPLSPNPPS